VAQDGAFARRAGRAGEICMTPVLAPLALVTSTGALLMVPLAPALRELIHKRDASPLVTRKDDGDISSFAASLRTRCIPLQATLQDCDLRAENELIEFSPGSAFVVGQHGNWRGPRHASMLVACGGPVELPAGFQSTEDFYSRGSVRCGQQSIFRALLSEEEIVLGNDTQILRWIHAESSLSAGTHCRLYGRASSAKSITLSAGSTFERIYAPVIYSSQEGAALSLRKEYAAYSRLAQSGIGRTGIHSHMHLSADEQHRGDVVATRTINLGQGASVLGSVKANGEIVLKERAEVHGSLVSTKRIHIASGCFVKGPIIAEREVIIDSGVQVGLPGTPTTVSAPLIHLASGSVLHGTAWAKIEGRVGD
jgi:cytoskeletal protein CcmA (bactofilin family)